MSNKIKSDKAKVKSDKEKVKSDKAKVKSDQLKSDKAKVNINKSIKNCENKFCKEHMKRNIKNLKEMAKFFRDKIIKAKPNDKFMGIKIDDEMKKKEEIDFKKSLEKFKSKKFKENIIKECKETYCNPGCKGTIYQNGTFPKELMNKYKNTNQEFMIKLLKSIRKSLFKDKKTVLKNDFFEKLSSASKLKKKGAISGCLQRNISNFKYK